MYCLFFPFIWQSTIVILINLKDSHLQGRCTLQIFFSGNIRELINIVERLVCVVQEDQIDVAILATNWTGFLKSHPFSVP